MAKGEGWRQISLVSFPICFHFRRLIIGLDVPVSSECEPDKSNRHKSSASYDQPIWIVSHFERSRLSQVLQDWGAIVLTAGNRETGAPRKGGGFLSVAESAPGADRYGDESDANP
jgi:hypothetical protein